RFPIFFSGRTPSSDLHYEWSENGDWLRVFEVPVPVFGRSMTLEAPRLPTLPHRPQRSTMINRREMLRRTGAAAATLGLAQFPFGWEARADGAKQRILMYTRSQTFEHPCIKRGKNNELSLAENIVVEMGKKHGLEVTWTKDGREFLPETLAKYDAFLF